MDTKIMAALIALIGVLLSAILSWWTARVTSRETIGSDYARRQSELALKITEALSSPDERVKNAAMRRFAVAVIKVVSPEDHRERGIVHFIPMHSRVTVGRDGDNDIVLDDVENSLSRHHCSFISDQKNVWIDDLISYNGTKISSAKDLPKTPLKDGDKIEIGPFRLEFRYVRPNSILSPSESTTD